MEDDDVSSEVDDSTPQEDPMAEDAAQDAETPPPRLMITKMVRSGPLPHQSSMFLFITSSAFTNVFASFPSGIGEFQVVRWYQRDWTIPQVLFGRCGTQWLRKIQRHRRHALRIRQTCEEIAIEQGFRTYSQK